MTSQEITQYINARNGELSSDEILQVIDPTRNSQLNHIVYENGVWNLWDDRGIHFSFIKRNWH